MIDPGGEVNSSGNEPESNSFYISSSRIEKAGMGCFSIHALQTGTRIVDKQNLATRRLSQREIPSKFLKYCPLLQNGQYLAPSDFNRMSPLWYINHSREPNLGVCKWKLIVTRDVAPDEELTVYYPDLLTHPCNRSWVVNEIHVDAYFHDTIPDCAVGVTTKQISDKGYDNGEETVFSPLTPDVCFSSF